MNSLPQALHLKHVAPFDGLHRWFDGAHQEGTENPLTNQRLTDDSRPQRIHIDGEIWQLGHSKPSHRKSS